MIGSQVSDFASAVKREHDMGMEQGNHSWDHKTLTHLTADQIASEISRTNDAIRSVTGSNPTLFRPPGGGYNDLVIANSFGMPMIMWSIDTLDWSHKNAQITYDTVMNSVQDGDIILMHEIYEQSYIAAQMLIPALLERGYRLVTVSELASARGYTLRSGISYGRLN
jgi:peptidoglycan/xylan/chitin deacetylase (PgdA/CDA1 family)